jgi:hypothetical protein
MLGGLWLLIYGGKYFHVTMFLAGQVSIAAFIMIILFASVYPKNSPFWVVWLTLFVALGMGSGVGYAAQRWSRIGVLFIGAWIGGLMGGMLYSSVFYVFSEDNPLLAIWLCISFSAIIVAVLSMIYFDHAVIIGAALGGSYIFVRVIINKFCL